MKKVIIIAMLVFITSNTLYAQSIITSSNPYAKSIYFELGGPGLASANFDMRFNKTGEGLGFRAGIGGFPGYDINLLTIPIGINYLASKDNRNFFEFGGGFTLINSKTSGTGLFDGSFGHTTFGYRLQPKSGGFTFRASLNPIIYSEGIFPFYGGVGFGWKF